MFVARTTWEELCAQHLWRRFGTGTLTTAFAQFGRWWNGKVDLVLAGLRRGRVTLVGERTWTTAPVDERILAAPQRTAHRPPIETPLWVLASRSGFERARRRAALGGLLLLTPAEMFVNAVPGRRHSARWRRGYHSTAPVADASSLIEGWEGRLMPGMIEGHEASASRCGAAGGPMIHPALSEGRGRRSA